MKAIEKLFVRRFPILAELLLHIIVTFLLPITVIIFIYIKDNT